MKNKIILIAIGAMCCTVSQNAIAANECAACGTIDNPPLLDPTCDTVPKICVSETTTNGCYITTTNKTIQLNCTHPKPARPEIVAASLTCITDAPTYACASHCYGTAKSASSGCAICPANATCNGGKTFSCNKGYYKDGTSCKQCPSSGGIAGTTKNSGATSITECYLPSGTSFSDSYGSGTYTSDCYYTK